MNSTRKYRYTLWCNGFGAFAMRATTPDACRRQFRRHWPEHKGRAVLITRDERRRSPIFVLAMEAWMDNYKKYMESAYTDIFTSSEKSV